VLYVVEFGYLFLAVAYALQEVVEALLFLPEALGFAHEGLEVRDTEGPHAHRHPIPRGAIRRMRLRIQIGFLTVMLR